MEQEVKRAQKRHTYPLYDTVEKPFHNANYRGSNSELTYHEAEDLKIVRKTKDGEEGRTKWLESNADGDQDGNCC